MSFTIDGKVYKSEFAIKFGEEFPKVNENRKVGIGGFGGCNIYITKLERPYWGKDLTVHIPVSFYITEVIYPEEEYLKNSNVIFGKKKPLLQLVKG